MLTNILPFLLLLGLGMPATAGGQASGFRPVAGSGLHQKLEAAVRRAHADSPGSRFWTAYQLDARPGVAVDTELMQFKGQIENFAGLQLFIGNEGGRPAQARNLAVFMLHDAGNSSVTRVEIYNLDRRRDYDGYPVYWLGRPASKESLDYLRRLAESNQPDEVAGRAAVAIALHDDPAVREVLKALVRNSPSATVRRVSTYWLKAE